MFPKIQSWIAQQERFKRYSLSLNEDQDGLANYQTHLSVQNQQAALISNKNRSNMNSTQNFYGNPNVQNNTIEGFHKRRVSNWNSFYSGKEDVANQNSYSDLQSESSLKSLGMSNYQLRNTMNKQHNAVNGSIGSSHETINLQQLEKQPDESRISSSNFQIKTSHSQKRNHRSLTHKAILDKKISLSNSNSSTTPHQSNQMFNDAYNQFGMESLTDATLQDQSHGLKNKRNLTLKQKVEELYQQIQDLYKLHNFQHFHCEYFNLFIQDIKSKRLYDILMREIKLINEKKSLYQIAFKTIRARENCLDKLKHATHSLQESYEKKNKQIDESQFDNACRLLTHLRILTIQAVESISIYISIIYFY